MQSELGKGAAGTSSRDHPVCGGTCIPAPCEEGDRALLWGRVVQWAAEGLGFPPSPSLEPCSPPHQAFVLRCPSFQPLAVQGLGWDVMGQHGIGMKDSGCGVNHPTQAHCRAVPAPLQQWGVRSCAANGVWELGTGGSGGKESRLALSQPSSLQFQGFRGCRVCRDRWPHSPCPDQSIQ